MKGSIGRKLTNLIGTASKERMALKVTSILVSLVFVLLSAVFISLSLYDLHGSFTITVDKNQPPQTVGPEPSLILSDDRNFKNTYAQITAKRVPDITNMTGDDLPKDIDGIDGQHNGENYFAFTFYLKNNGDAPCDYNYKLFIREVKKDVDKAIRIRVYYNGEPTTYARVRSDGSNLPEEGTTEFASIDTILFKTRPNFAPNDVDKFTVVIWIEGNDPDTTDDKIGGSIKLGMNFYINDKDEN